MGVKETSTNLGMETGRTPVRTWPVRPRSRGVAVPGAVRIGATLACRSSRDANPAVAPGPRRGVPTRLSRIRSPAEPQKQPLTASGPPPGVGQWVAAGPIGGSTRASGFGTDDVARTPPHRTWHWDHALRDGTTATGAARGRPAPRQSPSSFEAVFQAAPLWSTRSAGRLRRRGSWRCTRRRPPRRRCAGTRRTGRAGWRGTPRAPGRACPP